jgi:Tol biopolymer transport system component
VYANVPQRIALATLLAGMTGCTASVSRHGEQQDDARMASRSPASHEPSFGSQHRPVQMTETPGTDPARVNSLMSLYGELQSEWTADAGGPWDGSSNVAQVTFATEGACSDPDVSRDGSRMVFASTQHSPTSDIYIKPLPGRTLTQMTTDPGDDIMPVLDPSGRKIAFASNRSGNWDIYVMSLSGGQPMKVTEEPEHELHPSWSPDGHQIVFSKLGARSNRWEMWVVDLSNPGVRRFLDYGLFPQWCPDPARSKILFQRARQRGSRFFSVWTVDYINGDAVHPTEIVSAGNAAVINPAWSADGSRVVFVTVIEPDTEADTLEQSDVWVVNLDGSGRTNLTNGRYANYQPIWAGTGQVYFVSNRTGVDNIWSVSTQRALDTRQVTNVTTPPSYDIPVGRP